MSKAIEEIDSEIDEYGNEDTIHISNLTGEVTGFRVRDLQYATFFKLILFRLFNNRDVKILITSSGNTTGTGKTQLAVILAKIIEKYSAEIFDREENWSGKEHSFMDVYEYLEKYSKGVKGKPLITDELEYLADKRRSLSHENVYFSQAWQMLRYKNVITLATAPSQANLDMRIMENTDIWINVLYPGFASVYYVSMDDFTGQIEYKRMKQMGYVEIIRWKPIDNDIDYNYLTDMKEDIGIPGIDGNGKQRYDKEEVEKQKEELESETKQKITEKLLKAKENGKVSLTQEDIGDIVNRSQQFVSKVKRDKL